MTPSDEFPGLFIEEARLGARPIARAPTSVTAFVGWAPRGETRDAVLLHSFADYARHFGGLDARTALGHCVQHFFENGGSTCWVVRLVPSAAAANADGDVLTPNSAAFASALVTSLHSGSLQRLEAFNLLCVPGETTPAVIAQLARFCRSRGAFLIADAGRDATAASLSQGVPMAVVPNDAANVALYFPWLEAEDPLTKGQVRAFPPCGAVAGLYARTDATRGVWKAPAGTAATLSGVIRPAIPITDAEQEVLGQHAINVLRAFPVHGTVVWGARTLAGRDAEAPEWKYVTVRRLALHLETSIVHGVQWAVFERNDEPLWAQLRLVVSDLLYGLFRDGAFQGSSPRHAYFVKCGADTTTIADLQLGLVHIEVGFAPLKPAEFVVLRIVVRTAGA